MTTVSETDLAITVRVLSSCRVPQRKIAALLGISKGKVTRLLNPEKYGRPKRQNT